MVIHLSKSVFFKLFFFIKNPNFPPLLSIKIYRELLEYDVTLSPEKAQQITAVTVAHLNGFITEMRRLFLVENGVDSIKFGVILCVMTYIGAWFNGMTLVILGKMCLF